MAIVNPKTPIEHLLEISFLIQQEVKIRAANDWRLKRSLHTDFNSWFIENYKCNNCYQVPFCVLLHLLELLKTLSHITLLGSGEVLYDDFFMDCYKEFENRKNR